MLPWLIRHTLVTPAKIRLHAHTHHGAQLASQKAAQEQRRKVERRVVSRGRVNVARKVAHRMPHHPKHHRHEHQQVRQLHDTAATKSARVGPCGLFARYLPVDSLEHSHNVYKRVREPCLLTTQHITVVDRSIRQSRQNTL